MKDFSSRKKGNSDSDVPLFGRLRTSSAWGAFAFRCEGTASPKDSEAVARQRFSQQKILHGVVPQGKKKADATEHRFGIPSRRLTSKRASRQMSGCCCVSLPKCSRNFYIRDQATFAILHAAFAECNDVSPLKTNNKIRVIEPPRSRCRPHVCWNLASSQFPPATI